MAWQHDDLLDDLATYLNANRNRMVWRDMQLGPAGSPRPDVYTIMKSFSRPDFRAYEIKVSRSDFLADVTTGKWQSYLKFASCVIFAVPDGLIKRTEVPDGCGLIVRKDKTWRQTRRPTLNIVTPPRDAFMKLLIDGVDALQKKIQPREASVWQIAHRHRQELGQDVAECLTNLSAARARLEEIQRQSTLFNDGLKETKANAMASWRQEFAANEIDAESSVAALCDLFGWDKWRGRRWAYQSVRALIEATNVDDRIAKMQKALDNAAVSIEAARREPEIFKKLMGEE